MASLKPCNDLVMNFLTYILEHYYSYTNSKMIDVDRRFMFSDAHRYYLLYDTRKLTIVVTMVWRVTNL